MSLINSLSTLSLKRLTKTLRFPLFIVNKSNSPLAVAKLFVVDIKLILNKWFLLENICVRDHTQNL